MRLALIGGGLARLDAVAELLRGDAGPVAREALHPWPWRRADGTFDLDLYRTYYESLLLTPLELAEEKRKRRRARNLRLAERA